MKAVRFDGRRVLMDSAAPAPSAAPGEAVIRPALVGVTRMDLAVAAGASPFGPFTGILGSQFVGVVESIAPGGGAAPGAEAQSLAGRRVVGSPTAPCGKCDMCRSGLSAHCRDSTILGVRGRNGCFAERFTLPARCLVAVPDTVPDDAALFAQTVAAAIEAAQQIRIEGKPYITVLGDGAMGLIMAQALARLNASVRLIGQRDEKIARCERWGIKHRREDEIGRRADQDVVVDCTGRAEGLALAMQLVRPRGKIVLKSIGVTGVDLSPLVAHEIEIIGSNQGPIREAVGMLERGEVQTDGLITRRLRLDAAAEALRAAASPEQIRVAMEV